VKDPGLVGKTGFGAALRMPEVGGLEFFNSFPDPTLGITNKKNL
jgi:hypothetical protein